jgi:hypothetical protein
MRGEQYKNGALLTDESFLLDTGGERLILGRVAREQLGRVPDGVRVGTPAELDGITNAGVHSEGNISEDTLGRSDNDGVGNAVSTDASTIATGRAAGGAVGRAAGGAVGRAAVRAIGRGL